MKNMILVLIFLFSMCFDVCLAWFLVGVDNKLCEDVVLQVCKDGGIYLIAKIHANEEKVIGGSLDPVECPNFKERVHDLVDKNGSPCVNNYLIITVGQKNFIICEGLLGGMYATWVCELKSNSNTKILAYTAGLYGMHVFEKFRYILGLSFIESRRHPSKKNPQGIRKDIKFELRE